MAPCLPALPTAFCFLRFIDRGGSIHRFAWMRIPRFFGMLFELMLSAAASLLAQEVADPELNAAITRGQAIYFASCAMCHGATGDGVKGAFPPLARSDWLAAHRSGAIRAVVNGLKEEITVNGDVYRGQMPPVMLDDPQVADVLTFVVNSWGNTGGRITAENVQAVRATANFKTFEKLKAAADFGPLPKAPDGFTLRELVQLPDFGVRLASDGKSGRLYILGQAGDVWRFDPATGNLKQIIWAKDFSSLKPTNFQTLGLLRDSEGRLWITVNQRVATRPLETNERSEERRVG